MSSLWGNFFFHFKYFSVAYLDMVKTQGRVTAKRQISKAAPNLSILEVDEWWDVDLGKKIVGFTNQINGICLF